MSFLRFQITVSFQIKNLSLQILTRLTLLRVVLSKRIQFSRFGVQSVLRSVEGALNELFVVMQFGQFQLLAVDLLFLTASNYHKVIYCVVLALKLMPHVLAPILQLYSSILNFLFQHFL